MSDTDDAIRTFRGRSIEQVIPRIRAELGADAIVLRSRERLEGGIAGFFQRQVVEIEARAALPHEVEDELRNDRATQEGLATPALKALVDQAQPFAAQLAVAQQTAAERAEELLARAAIVNGPDAGAEPADAGLYGPQPNLLPARPREAAFTPIPAPQPAFRPDPLPAAAREPGPARPLGADGLELRLVAAGLSPHFAADVVGEAIDHRLPFGGPRDRLDDHARAVLAGRLKVMGDVGPGRRTVAIVGGAGAGKTALAANLAVAYAAAGRRVAVLALAPPDGGRALMDRLEPLGLHVHVVADAEEARRRLAHTQPVLAVIDTPSIAPGDRRASAGLATQLRAMRPDEIHLALPATLSRPAAAEAHASLASLDGAFVALTHADATQHPGAVLEAVAEAGRPVSYVSTRATVRPADPAELAQRLLT